MTSRLIISPTFDLHLASSSTLGSHLTKPFAHLQRASLDVEPSPAMDSKQLAADDAYPAHPACLQPCRRLPPCEMLAVSSFKSVQIYAMSVSPASSNADEMLYQGDEGLYVSRLPAR